MTTTAAAAPVDRTERHRAGCAAIAAVWTEAGMTMPHLTHIDSPRYGGGSGRRVVITAHDRRIHVNGTDVGCVPRHPVTDAGYYADMIWVQRQVVALVLTVDV